MSLKHRIESLATRAKPFHGEVYRSASPKYATSRDLLTGEGAKQFGGRWNPVGVAAIYGSLTPQTALEETLAHAKYYGLPINTSMPRTFVAIQAELSYVLDLTVGKNRQSMRVSEKRMLDCDWRAECSKRNLPITQRIGGLVAAAGIEGILVRSSADEAGLNLIVFPSNLAQSSCLSVVAPDRLDA